MDHKPHPEELSPDELDNVSGGMTAVHFGEDEGSFLIRMNDEEYSKFKQVADSPFGKELLSQTSLGWPLTRTMFISEQDLEIVKFMLKM